MISTDGECPLCGDQPLQLNHLDLLECPKCHPQLCVADPVVATVMSVLRQGQMREDQGSLPNLDGAALAKSKNGGVLPDLDAIFTSRDDLAAYFEGLLKQRLVASELEQTDT